LLGGEGAGLFFALVELLDAALERGQELAGARHEAQRAALRGRFEEVAAGDAELVLQGHDALGHGEDDTADGGRESTCDVKMWLVRVRAARTWARAGGR